MKPKNSRFRWRGCLLAVLGAAGFLALTGIYLSLFVDYAGPNHVKVNDPGASPAGGAYVLGEDQAEILAELGPPDSFTILFYQEPGETSPEDIRFEVWRYHAAGREVSFVNGESSSDAPLDVPDEPLGLTPYSPEQFAAYMSLKDLLAQTRIGEYARGASEPELVAGGELYFADRLAFAMLRGKLVAVEAIALEAEG